LLGVTQSKLKIEDFLSEQKGIVDEHLDNFLVSAATPPKMLHKAMRYSVFAGGKRIRPIMALTTGAGLGGDLERLIHLACALEMIHTYSLIHDDLPAMDDDDYRRGHLTCHKKFGEGIAILAGNALLTRGFQLLTEMPTALAESKVAVTDQICQAIGTRGGMIAGQVMDLEAQGNPYSKSQLKMIHSSKTAALIRASILTPALLLEASPKTCARLSAFGSQMGLAFQIVDDILDVEGSSKELGKAAGKDNLQQKATYPALYGVERSRELAIALVGKAVEEVSFMGSQGNLLRELARFISVRRF